MIAIAGSRIPAILETTESWDWWYDYSVSATCQRPSFMSS